jgi:glycosyltransferase involved in cell wall biosynthesis
LATRQILAGENVEVWGITASPLDGYPEKEYLTRLYQAQKKIFKLDTKLIAAMGLKTVNTTFHLHGGFLSDMYAAAMLLKKNNIPFVFTPHGSYNIIAMQRSWFRKKIYFALFERRLLNAAQAIHCLGRSEVTGLQSVFQNNKSVLIPYGFEVAEQKQFVAGTTSFVIGFCGRLDIYTKGLKELFEGFRLFRVRNPKSQLWIIGGGPGEAKLRKIAADLKLGDSVVFFGSKYGDEKNELLQQCDMFAAPSRNEGLPTAVLEAAAMGIPCLVTEATNMGDYIREHDAGVVIKQTHPVEISQGMQKIWQQVGGQEKALLLSNNAQKMIADAFNWDVIVTRFHKLYMV